jgi:hypothetical protein
MTDEYPITPATIARVLEIAEPPSATAEALREWVEWWTPSYRSARLLSDEQRAYLKQGGWWPPVSAHQIARPAPAIVIAAARPALYGDKDEPSIFDDFDAVVTHARRSFD